MKRHEIEHAHLLAAISSLDAIWTTFDALRHVYPELFEGTAAGPYDDLSGPATAASHLYLALRLLRSSGLRYRDPLAEGDPAETSDTSEDDPW